MGDAHQDQDVQGQAFDAAEAARAGSGGGGVVGTAGPGRILALQRTIGNAAVGRLVAGRGPEMRQLARSASPAGPRLRAPAVTLARFVDPDSPEYVRGYNDGRGNHDAAPGPLLDDALESYTEGYRRGKSEAEGSKTSSPPVAAPAPETPAPPETFTNPDLQQIYDANKPGKPNQLIAMKLLDTTVTGVWSKLTWGPLAKSAAARIYSPNLMAQGSLGTCGPATVLNFLGTSDPPAYAALVIEVYRDGTGKGSGVNKKLRDATPQPGMDALDWMMMSAVQDITNDWYDFHGTKEGEEAKREGTTSGDQRWAYKKFAGVVEAKTIDTPKHDDVLPAARRVNGLVTTSGVSINMHISAAVLQNAASGPNERNHVIRLLKPIAITENPDDSKSNVEFDAFTWGRVFHWKGTVNQFIHMIWAFSIASKTTGVI